MKQLPLSIRVSNSTYFIHALQGFTEESTSKCFVGGDLFARSACLVLTQVASDDICADLQKLIHYLASVFGVHAKAFESRPMEHADGKAGSATRTFAARIAFDDPKAARAARFYIKVCI